MMDNKLKMKRKMMAEKMARKKPMGYTVQSPDQQYGTGQMGKQPIPVYPPMGNAQKRPAIKRVIV